MTTVPLGPQASLPGIAAIHRAVADALAQGDDAIHIDLADLAEADFSLIQLLAAARADAARAGRSLHLAGAENPVFAGLLARAGINPATPADIAFWHHGACDA